MSDPSTYDGGALLVLEEQLRREMTRVEERRRELEASRDLLARITSQALGAHEPLSEPIDDALAPSVVSRLLAETTGLLRNYVLSIAEGPALDESTMRANEERIRRGEEQRAVYPASALSTPQGQRWMTSWAEVGEDQRILPTTDTEFAVFGSAAVVALAAIAASSLADLVAGMPRVRPWMLPLAMFLGGGAALLAATLLGGPDSGPAALTGFLAAAVAHAVRRVLSVLPAVGSFRAQLASAAASLLVPGVVVYVLSLALVG
ncbi:hypothetical protein [Hyphomicrobium sulfonivorans]|uniref:hypothetical protein n=1 Tax=Hyphomicrobium sulfonivorans TaxID=121290 RepID=UPI00157152EA|nr:hypothetical protein [Hyphomicrobium sulfonivorans]